MSPNGLTTLLGTALLTAGSAVVLVVPTPALAASGRCQAADLKITAVTSPSGDSHAAYVLRFENVSDHHCSLHGYPGVDAVGRHGTVKAHAKRTRSGYSGGSQHAPTTVNLARHHYASAIIEWVNLDSHYADHLRVTAPNTRHTVSIYRHVEVHSLQIHPVVAGKTGSN